MGKTAYNKDVIAWANEQATFLREGRFDLLDIEHLADEIEDVGKSEARELENRMAVLICHLLKWEYQPDYRGASWSATIREQRGAVLRRLKKTPSLKSFLHDEDWLQDVWTDAKTLASKETGIGFAKFPSSCSWPMESILSEAWLPTG